MIVEFKCDVERCRLVETWRAKAPDGLAGDDLSDFLYEALNDGRAEFVEQTVSDEQDRTIIGALV